MTHTHEQSDLSATNRAALESITGDRTRTNLLRKPEQRAIVFLVQRIPSWVSSNMLTAIGFFGSIIVFVSFILATYLHRSFLLLGIIGFMISWFGDSLDGRIAYFRNKARKWYGFVLDITFDWMGIILIGCGYLVYSKGIWELLGYGFVVMYSWEMIIAILRYKITGKYSIDAGIMGPTEARILISAILATEVIIPGSIIYSVGIICVILFFININDTRRLLQTADELDIKEKEKE
ncbi:MAG: CDP-alcohol phosphatidyltransferase family protein [Bacteroidales bacterium]|nr:CDP-alcohol phosphatidyltransferase family protein [Bacteroidales bacterium]